MLKDINMRDRLIIGATHALTQYMQGATAALDNSQGEPPLEYHGSIVGPDTVKDLFYNSALIDNMLANIDYQAARLQDDTPGPVLQDTTLVAVLRAIDYTASAG